MKKIRKNLPLYVTSLCIVLVSLVVMVLDYAVPLNLWFHPALNFLFCVLTGFGVFCIVLGIVKKSPWYFFLSSGQLVLSLIYLLIFYKVDPFIIIISAVVLCVVICLSSLMVCGNKTEDIALNSKDDYKDYKEREKENSTLEIKEELPEIKSFKD